MQLKAILAFLLFFGVLFTITPTVSALSIPTGWSLEVPGADNVVDYAKMATNGDRLAVFWHNSALTTFGFAVRDSGVWAVRQQTLALSNCAATNAPVIQLIATGTNSWTVWCIGSTNTNYYTYHTTNDGVSWAAGIALTAQGNIFAADAAQATVSNDLFIVRAVGIDLCFQKSADGGLTFSTTCQVISDNVGPGGTSTDQRGISTASIIAYDSNKLEVWFTSGTGGVALYRVSSSDGGNFWTLPYASPGSATPTPIVTGLSNTAITPVGIVGGGITKLHQWTPPSVMSSFVGGVSDPVSTETTSCVSGGATVGTNIFQPPLSGNPGNVFLRAFMCGTTLERFQYKLSTNSWSDTFSFTTTTALLAVDTAQTATISYVSYANPDLGGRLEVLTQITPQAPATFTPQATQSVTSLVGFDVDQTGSAVVTRENNGDVVNAYSGNDLNLAGTVATPNCSVGSLFDGVAIEYGTIITPSLVINEPFIIYETCKANGRTDKLFITSSQLGDPTFNPYCDQQPGSCQNPLEDKPGCAIALGCGQNFENDVDVPDVAQISELVEAPWDWSNYHVGNSAPCSGGSNGLRGCGNYALISLAFSDPLNDHVGIFSVVQNGDPPGDQDFGTGDSQPTVGRVTIANVQDPAQICTTTFNGSDYMGAIGTGDAYRSWQIRVTAVPNSGSSLGWYIPSNSFTLTNSLSTGNFNDPISVACSQNIVGVLNSNGVVTFLALNGGSQGNVISSATIGIHGRGLILSNPTCPSCTIAKGNYFYGYINLAETEIKIVNMTSNAVVATLAVPSGVGSYVGMKFDRNAQHLFLAQSGQVSVWDIHDFTTIRSLPAGQALSPTNQTVTVGISDGLPDSNGNGISDSEEAACIASGACVGPPGNNATQAAGQSFASSLFNGYFSPLVASYVATAILVIILELFVLVLSWKFSNGGSTTLYTSFFMLGLALGVPVFGLPWIVIAIILIPVVALIVLKLRGGGSE